MNIRKATESDLPGIFQLVRELAIYEKEPDAITIDLSDYERCFRDGNFESFVAENGAGVIVGITLFYFGFSTWNGKLLFLEDFVVTESERGSGVGTKLFEAVIERARETGVKRMKWQVLDWNEPAINFYQKYSTTIQKGWLNVNLYEKELNGNPRG